MTTQAAEQPSEAVHVPPPPGMPVSDVDPYAVETILNPYPMHEALRELGPIVWLSRYNVAAVSRYAAVDAVLMDPENFLSSGGVGMSDIRKPGAWRTPGPLVEADPPQHAQVRLPLNRIFSPPAIRAWREPLMKIAAEACDKAIAGGTFDAVAELVEPYILAALGGALGVDLDMKATQIVGHHSFNSSGPRNDLFYASLARAETVAAWYEEKQGRDAMLPGGFGEKVFQAEEAGDLPPGAASGVLRTLIRGGMDTTVSGLSTSLRLLAQNPDVWAALADDPSLATAIFEEAIRLESPTQAIYRTTAREVAFDGVRVPPDTKVQVMIGAGNRDPREWEKASEFRPGGRPGKRILAFGAGPHICLGRVFSRLEVECMLTALRARVDRLELAGPVTYRAVHHLRSPQTVPIKISNN